MEKAISYLKKGHF